MNDTLAIVETMEADAITTTTITPTTQFTTMQVQRTVIPQDPDEQQKVPFLVEDSFSVKPQQPQGESEGECDPDRKGEVGGVETLPAFMKNQTNALAMSIADVNANDGGGGDNAKAAEAPITVNVKPRSYAATAPTVADGENWQRFVSTTVRQRINIYYNDPLGSTVMLLSICTYTRRRRLSSSQSSRRPRNSAAAARPAQGCTTVLYAPEFDLARPCERRCVAGSAWRRAKWSPLR